MRILLTPQQSLDAAAITGHEFVTLEDESVELRLIYGAGYGTGVMRVPVERISQDAWRMLGEVGISRPEDT